MYASLTQYSNESVIDYRRDEFSGNYLGGMFKEIIIYRPRRAEYLPELTFLIERIMILSRDQYIRVASAVVLFIRLLTNRRYTRNNRLRHVM